MRRAISISLLDLATAGSGHAQQLGSDIPKSFKAVEASFDYDRRSVDIPMRDGVKLHAVIMIHLLKQYLVRGRKP